MSSTQQVLINKLTAASCEDKLIQAAERRDYAAVCFMLLKQLREADEDIYHHEEADKHNYALHQKTCEKLKAVKEENAQLKVKIKQQQFDKDVAQRGSEQMIEWYEQDDQIQREEIADLQAEIRRLNASNIKLQNDLLEFEQLEKFTDKATERNGELSDTIEDLRQQIGYTAIELEESKRTANILAVENGQLVKKMNAMDFVLGEQRDQIYRLISHEKQLETKNKKLETELAKRTADPDHHHSSQSIW